ncbi:hypothetical protein FALCPG4_006664 [Fusarium falciforme]
MSLFHAFPSRLHTAMLISLQNPPSPSSQLLQATKPVSDPASHRLRPWAGSDAQDRVAAAQHQAAELRFPSRDAGAVFVCKPPPTSSLMDQPTSIRGLIQVSSGVDGYPWLLACSQPQPQV